MEYRTFVSDVSAATDTDTDAIHRVSAATTDTDAINRVSAATNTDAIHRVSAKYIENNPVKWEKMKLHEKFRK